MGAERAWRSRVQLWFLGGIDDRTLAGLAGTYLQSQSSGGGSQREEKAVKASLGSRKACLLEIKPKQQEEQSSQEQGNFQSQV